MCNLGKQKLIRNKQSPFIIIEIKNRASKVEIYNRLSFKRIMSTAKGTIFRIVCHFTNVGVIKCPRKVPSYRKLPDDISCNAQEVPDNLKVD